MKTAGYDMALLVNERFLNQLSGALFYSGFLTINGSVDMYNGTMELEHQLMDYNKALSEKLEGQVPADLQSFMKLDFRLKLTQEPLIRFVQGTGANQHKVQMALGMRIYFWLWQGVEIKFDAAIALTTPLQIGKDMNLTVDLAFAEVEELTLKYCGKMERPMALQLNDIIEKALHMYFANHRISQRLMLPSISAVVKDVTQYIHPDKDEKGNNLGIIPISVDAIKIVSPTVMAVGINLMDYKGGDPDKLHDFARNCSMALAVSETAMFKVFSYVWTHSHFARILGNKGDMALVKEYDALSIIKAGTFKVKKLDEFFTKVSDIASFVERNASKALTAGFLEADAEYKGMDFNYFADVTLKNEPKFDLLGGNLVALYNMAFSVYLHLSCRCSIEYEVELDTSGWIPDSWTPWNDDVTLYRETKTITVFDKRIYIDNLELRYGRGLLVWNEKKQSLELEVQKINLYWNFDKPGSPLYGLPGALINWITDQLEDDIVKKIPRITITPELTFNLPYIPWPLEITGKRLEITNSEAIIAADMEFEVLKKDVYPVPKYVVNINNKEIHKIGCDSVTDTYEVHQRSYHLLDDALNKGFDGCKNCLPAFHHK